ncbi:hypothetical protein Ciccas_009284 [Cichlidogyrus casuarinus]|uniref:Uncharacterized protein n=1 Tax=Cichlidogyrus casuarinus TaxID=1844966 RepID=A0ABD2PY56_9PLAT
MADIAAAQGARQLDSNLEQLLQALLSIRPTTETTSCTVAGCPTRYKYTALGGSTSNIRNHLAKIRCFRVIHDKLKEDPICRDVLRVYQLTPCLLRVLWMVEDSLVQIEALSLMLVREEAL